MRPGAVALNLSTIADVEAAFAKMSHLSDRFLLEEMQQDAVCEIIIGVKRDPQFGLALVIGSGGVLVNLIEDSASLLLPTQREDIETALDGLKVARLLAGYRGKAAGDRDALIKAITTVADWAMENSQSLFELDVNPLLVLPDGHGAIAVDALIRVLAD